MKCWRIPLVSLALLFVCCSLCAALERPRLRLDAAAPAAAPAPRSFLPSLARIVDFADDAALPLYFGLGGHVLALDSALSCHDDFRLLAAPSLRGRPLGVGLSFALNDAGALGFVEVASGVSGLSVSSLPYCGSMGLRLPF